MLNQCSITKSFLEAIIAFYEEVNLETKKVEIIYIPFDKVKKEYDSFTKTMPWLGLPFNDERAPSLKEFYDIRSIPKLLLIDDHGEQVANDCRSDLYGLSPDDVEEKWRRLRSEQEKNYRQ